MVFVGCCLCRTLLIIIFSSALDWESLHHLILEVFDGYLAQDNNGLSKQATEEDLSTPLIYQSGVESFIHSQTSGEVCVGHGGSFTQTVFNGLLSLSCLLCWVSRVNMIYFG